MKAGKLASTHQLTGSDEEAEEYHLYNSSTGRSKPMEVSVTLNGVETTMEVDTGATLSVIIDKTYQFLWSVSAQKPHLKPISARLKTYTGEQIVVKGSIHVHALYQTQLAYLDLLMVAGEGPSLLGRDWLECLKLDWHSNKYTSTASRLQDVLDKHSRVFGEDLDHIKGTPATIHVNPNHTPRFYKARPVPYSLRSKVENELSRPVQARA